MVPYGLRVGPPPTGRSTLCSRRALRERLALPPERLAGSS